MNRIPLLFIAFCLFFNSCQDVPVTGRNQLNVLPENTLIEMSLTNYEKFLQQYPPLDINDSSALLVNKVGTNISKSIKNYLDQNNYINRIKDYKWEFNLINNKEANAWCMPGGKVVVYTGLLPFTKDETGLAFVMGHEIAHAIARHGNERMSHSLLAQAGSIILSLILADVGEGVRDIFYTAYGVGSSLGVMLPYSRIHESEADRMGLIFMAMAGYDPKKATEFWIRMSKNKNSPNPPEILSTHPSDETRIKNIETFLPEAMKYYKANI